MRAVECQSTIAAGTFVCVKRLSFASRATMTYETIDFQANGPIARITLNRPDRLNSFTVRMHEEVRDALDNLGDARVILLTGAGRGFCAGPDLGDRADAPGKAVDLGTFAELVA